MDKSFLKTVSLTWLPFVRNHGGAAFMNLTTGGFIGISLNLWFGHLRALNLIFPSSTTFFPQAAPWPSPKGATPAGAQPRYFLDQKTWPLPVTLKGKGEYVSYVVGRNWVLQKSRCCWKKILLIFPEIIETGRSTVSGRQNISPSLFSSNYKNTILDEIMYVSIVYQYFETCLLNFQGNATIII